MSDCQATLSASQSFQNISRLKNCIFVIYYTKQQYRNIFIATTLNIVTHIARITSAHCPFSWNEQRMNHVSTLKLIFLWRGKYTTVNVFSFCVCKASFIRHIRFSSFSIVIIIYALELRFIGNGLQFTCDAIARLIVRQVLYFALFWLIFRLSFETKQFFFDHVKYTLLANDLIPMIWLTWTF